MGSREALALWPWCLAPTARHSSAQPNGRGRMSIVQVLPAGRAGSIVVRRKVAGPTSAESSEHWRISPTQGFHRRRRDTVRGFGVLNTQWTRIRDNDGGIRCCSWLVYPGPSGRMVCPYEYPARWAGLRDGGPLGLNANPPKDVQTPGADWDCKRRRGCLAPTARHSSAQPNGLGRMSIIQVLPA
jgi:hypothetical protein